MEKNLFVIGLIFFVILTFITPIALGNNIKTQLNEMIIEDYNSNRYLISEFYDSYNVKEISDFIESKRNNEFLNNDNCESQGNINANKLIQLCDGPMNSPWPMYCHDVRHTGRSSYSTADNPGLEKWRVGTTGWADGCPVIDKNGIIYIGAKVLNAIYPNGTIKWKYDIPHKIVHAPAIDEDGIIYFGTIEAFPDYLYAVYTNNGSLKWKFEVGGDIWSSPVIGNDGTVYFGDAKNYINALNPNGTIKWRYKTNNVVYSSPAIGEDGVIYCGSHDTYLYALYPNNGTLKWKYKTGHWIRTAPSIADDGTIYVVSLDNYLHAVNPNGILNWKTDVDAGTSPTIGQDGTIYCGYAKLYAVNPTNGSIKWAFNPGNNRFIRGGTPCNSIDGSIYFGTNIGEYDGGEIIAVYQNGTEKWRKTIANYWVDSAPAIGEDGTIYIGSAWSPSDGYLYAIGELDPDVPSAPTIDGETSGTVGVPYTYTLTSTSPIGNSLYYFIEWGDGSIDDWFGPYHSGEEAQATHTWSNPRTYTIKAKAMDTDGLLSKWGELQIVIPKNKKTIPQTFPNTKESNLIFSLILFSKVYLI